MRQRITQNIAPPGSAEDTEPGGNQPRGSLVVSDSSNSASGGGVGFAGLLTIVFIVLKLCGVISWPWLWVLAPLWIGLALILLVLGVVVLVAVVKK